MSKKIEETVVDTYKAIKEGVVGACKAVEDSVVGAYQKVEDAFVEKFLTKPGETVDDAKARLKDEE